jgi:uncharacterized membrane protein
VSEFVAWKTLHVLCAAVLLGTGAGIAFFCWFGYRGALRSGEIAALRMVLRLTVIADACFTAPAVVLQVVTGVVLSDLYGWPLVSPWSLTVWGLFLVVSACWLPVLVIQKRLLREASAAGSMDALSPEFRRRFRLWFMLGVPAFGSVIAIYYLMVAKPLPVI